MAAQAEREAVRVVAVKAAAEEVAMVTAVEAVEAVAAAAVAAVRLRPNRSLAHPHLRSCRRAPAQIAPAWREPYRQKRRQHWCGRPAQGLR